MYMASRDGRAQQQPKKMSDRMGLALMLWLAMRNLDERHHARTMALGLAVRQCCGLKREGEELLPADEQANDDTGRAAVENCVRRLLAISDMSRVSARWSSLGASHWMYPAVACA
jgi:hypothetical protein